MTKRSVKLNGKTKYKCEECVKEFAYHKTYSEHLRKHRRDYEKNDEACTQDNLEEPRSKKSKTAARRVKCKKKKKKPLQDYKFRCEQCKKPFMLEDSYQAHLRVHQGLPRYSCNICLKVFKERTKYEYHMKKERGERDWKCSVCEKGFLIEWDLELHMRTHTDYRPYICDICGKAFRVYCHLSEHIETHNETNLFECTICGAKLHTKKTLRGHMASAHRVGGIKYCPICNQIFVRMHRLKEHVAKNHSDVNIILDESFGKNVKQLDVSE